jgi:hypothetical protein
MLNAGQETNGVLLPRQSAKTTTMTIVLVGRCAMRPKYNAAMTLTTRASKSSEVFDQVILTPLEDNFPEIDSRPFKIYRGKGSEHVRFPNGSRLSQKTAKGTSFRASAYDAVWIDEAGEATAEQGEDLLGAIMSTFDTRDGQLISTGTAGDFRTGNLLWEALEAPNGRVRYAMPDTTTGEELENWNSARALIESMHPGLACGLTTAEKLERRWKVQSPERFGREYGGIFGTDATADRLISAEDWESGRIIAEEFPTPPERFAIAYGIQRDGRASTVVAAWRDDAGNAHVLSMKARDGSDWVADKVHDLGTRYRVPAGYDTINRFARAEADKLERARPRVKLVPCTTADVGTAAALLVTEARAGRVRHYDQPAMNEAAEVAVKRSFRGSATWGIGPAHPEDDVSPIEAAAMALRTYDVQTRDRRKAVSTMRLG